VHGEIKNVRMTCRSVKWLKGAELEDLEGGLLTWIGQMSVKN
jgi:hypothetical protein